MTRLYSSYLCYLLILSLFTIIFSPFNTFVLSNIDIDFDPYKELNIPRHATQKEIKKAYKKLALKYHPDRSKDDSTSNKMSRLNKAFDVIGNEKRRKEYDRESQQQHGFNIFRHTNNHRKDDGLGILLTHDNSYNLLRNLNDHKPWLIYAYSDWNHHNNKIAKGLFEEACSKLGGIAHCGKFNADRSRSLQNEFNVRRVPLFIVYYNDFENDMQYSKTIDWNKNDVKAGTLVNALNQVLPKTCQMIYDFKDKTTFFESNNIFLNKNSNANSINNVKALIFSDAQNRKKPHILLQYLANMFSKTMEFGYHYMDNNHRKQDQTKKIASSVGLEFDDLEPPEMYVFRSPLILDDIITLMKTPENENSKESMKTRKENSKNVKTKHDFTLEDMGIYRISLESAVDSMTQFVLQYSTPLIPRIDADNFIDFCYLGNDGKVDESKVCFIFGLLDETESHIKDMLIFGQYLSANIDDAIPQFGWVNCIEQKDFCQSINLKPKNKNSFTLTALWMPNEKYINYQTDFDFNDNNNNNKNNKNLNNNNNNNKIYENNDIIYQTSQWIIQLEEDSNNNNNNKDIKWKRNPNIQFPVKRTDWKDDMNNWVIGPILKLLGFGVSAVGTGASAVGTIVSYFLQFGMLFLFMFILLPMLRAIG